MVTQVAFISERTSLLYRMYIAAAELNLTPELVFCVTSAIGNNIVSCVIFSTANFSIFVVDIC